MLLLAQSVSYDMRPLFARADLFAFIRFMRIFAPQQCNRQ